MTSSGGPESRHVGRYRLLPVLSWLLVALVAVWLTKHYVWDRPSDEHRRRVAAFDRALRLIPERYAKRVEERDLYGAAMRGMLESLGDRYSVYLAPAARDEVRVVTKGDFGGIGVMVAADDGAVVITEVQDGGPAAEAGLAAGDVIIKVDEVDCAGRSFQEVVSMVRGRVGTSVALVVRREGEKEPRSVSLVRKKITLETVKWKLLAPGIGYLQVRQFDAHTGDRVEEGLKELLDGGAKGLVLDLRDNTGGLLDQTVRVCDMLLNEATVLVVRNWRLAEGKEHRTKDGVLVPIDLPLVVLVNRRTASAAEIVAGALKHYRHATLMGAPTFGKGAVNEIYGLPDGSGVLITTAFYELGSGETVEGKGIEPDILVGEMPPFPGEDRDKMQDWFVRYKEAREEQLTRAREFLEEKVR